MHLFFRNKFTAIGVAVLLIMAFSSCKDACETEICSPCPSSRFVMKYQDSTSSCVPAFHANAMIYGFNKDAPSDTIRRYSLTDSCSAVFLVQEDLIYHLVSGTIRDTIEIETFEYQEPLEVTECCLCYPIAHIHMMLNGVLMDIEFPAGEYQNTPHIRNL